MARIHLIGTGGTIASRAQTEGGPVTAGLTAQSLLAGLHDPLTGIEVSAESFQAKGSYALDLATVFRLCRRIDDVLADPSIDGVVVTHGTDTMEESAYLAYLLVSSDKPVVFTGAQRHAGEADTDGPRNIAEAIRAAACNALTGAGATICFEGEIHSARHVTKFHSSRVDTFRSPGFGKLGDVDGPNVHVTRLNSAKRKIFTPAQIDPDVELMLLGLGSRADFLSWAVANGASGVVLAAFGRGNAPVGFAQAAADAIKKGVPVLVASRCPEGRTMPIYGNDSGGRTLDDAGVIFAGDLPPVKTRLLLAVLLGSGYQIEEIRRYIVGFGEANPDGSE
ncbi:asparaginase [Thioclava kandeliae]|uniref:Asparaginase n=1 Tax=Thioclava kandeliae TaxID=3070818 RepID=A0ABV1SLS1_9RHOB